MPRPRAPRRVHREVERVRAQQYPPSPKLRQCQGRQEIQSATARRGGASSAPPSCPTSRVFAAALVFSKQLADIAWGMNSNAGERRVIPEQALDLLAVAMELRRSLRSRAVARAQAKRAPRGSCPGGFRSGGGSRAVRAPRRASSQITGPRRTTPTVAPVAQLDRRRWASIQAAPTQDEVPRIMEPEEARAGRKRTSTGLAGRPCGLRYRAFRTSLDLRFRGIESIAAVWRPS